MMRRRTVVSAVASAVGAGATAGCLTNDGSSGATDDGNSGEQETLADTATADGGDGSTGTGDGSGTEAGGGTDEGSADVDFGAEVESIEKCGTTCRTLTYALRNTGADAAADVVVGIRVFTGGENVYDEDQAVGTIDASSQRTGITRDIDVGLMGAQNIKSNDGEIRIELAPAAGGVSETFEFEATLDV